MVVMNRVAVVTPLVLAGPDANIYCFQSIINLNVFARHCSLFGECIDWPWWLLACQDTIQDKQGIAANLEM